MGIFSLKMCMTKYTLLFIADSKVNVETANDLNVSCYCTATNSHVRTHNLLLIIVYTQEVTTDFSKID